ncbi:MAG TPA: hypothetical protein VGK54_02215 [Chloroflexota bacterium]|jgi:hypothetical protein
MREATKSETEPNQETTANAGYAWKSKWGFEGTEPIRSRAFVPKIVAAVLVGVVVIAVAVFLLVGGPSKLANRNVQRPAAISTVVTVPAQGQPANDSVNLIPQINPAAGS